MLSRQRAWQRKSSCIRTGPLHVAGAASSAGHCGSAAVEATEDLTRLLGAYPMRRLSAQILEYHVVPGMSLSSGNLTDGQMLQTMLPGQSIQVRHSCASCSHHIIAWPRHHNEGR